MSEKKKILVVDDDSMIRKYLEMLLERRGYVVIMCRDGQEAYERVMTKRLAYDLLLTDKTMQQMHGPELARRLRESGCRQPAILMTGEDAHLLGDLPGIDHVFQKPFENSLLVAKIEELLETSVAR